MWKLDDLEFWKIIEKQNEIELEIPQFINYLAVTISYIN